VAQTGDRERLAPEAFGRRSVRDQLLSDDFDRDRALEVQVNCAVDRAHAARAEQRLDPVLAVDDRSGAQPHAARAGCERGRQELGRERRRSREETARPVVGREHGLHLAPHGLVAACLREERRALDRLEVERLLENLADSFPVDPHSVPREIVRSGSAAVQPHSGL
jgi:hypothetical protein